MQPAFWPQKTMLPRLFRADLDKAGSLPVPQFRGRPVRVKWQFLFGICTKKPARPARDRWWLVLRLACELQRASYATRPRAGQDRYFIALRNLNRSGIVVKTPTARSARPAVCRSAFSKLLLRRSPIPTASALP